MNTNLIKGLCGLECAGRDAKGAFLLEAGLEVGVGEGFDQRIVGTLLEVDCGQGHTIEGVVLNHGVDGHILKYEGLALF